MKTKMFVLVMVSVLMFKAGLGGLVSTNGVPTVSSRSGIVSVGPIVVTNGCSINFAADQSVLKVELTAEINKAKFELAEENRNRMYAIRDEIEKMRKDAVADVRSRIKQEFSTLKSDVVKWYDELKDILDVRLNIFTWVIGILVALFGVAAPVVMEVMRGRDYERLKTELREDMENMQNEFVVEKKIIDDAKEKWQMKMADVAKTEANFIVLQNQLEQGAKNLEQNLQTLKSEITARKEEVEEVRHSLEQQKKGMEEDEAQRQKTYEGFKKEFSRQVTDARGISAFVWADMHDCQGKIADAMVRYNIALELFVKAQSRASVQIIIERMNEIDVKLRDDGEQFNVVKNDLVARLFWSVSPEDVKRVLAKEKDIEKLIKMFERVYKTYGKPKPEEIPKE